MTTADALALAAEHAAADRRSVTRIVALSTAKAIARGLVPYVAEEIEASVLDDLGVRRDAEGVDITWHAHAGQPGGDAERLQWHPGTPLPGRALFASCTASAPWQ